MHLENKISVLLSNLIKKRQKHVQKLYFLVFYLIYK